MHLDTGHRRNNFDFLRITAALMVLFGHSYVLSGRAQLDPLVRHTGFGGFGELGVSIFFVISGFLVTASFERLPRLGPYLAARVLRILPGLALAVVLTAFVLGPLVTRLSAADYFAQGQTWVYPVRNLLLYPVTYILPGVFEANPYPGAVNGSLWTLRLEFSFYLLIPLLAVVGGLRRWPMAALVAALALALVLAPPSLPPIALIGLRNLFLFVAGAALWSWRDTHWLRHPTLVGTALLAGGLGAAAGSAAGVAVTFLAIPLIVVAVALRPMPGLSSISRFGDWSYGVYIYAFPVQQLWMHLLGPEGLGIWAFTALTLAVVLPLAIASWLLVEAPALALKSKVRARLAGGVSAAAAEAEAAERPG